VKSTGTISTESKIKYKFILFISGMSVKSLKAIENLRKICDTHLKDNFELEIIDINKEKELAIQHQIIALPTLIKLQPFPKRTLVGDLSDINKVLRTIGVID
jgi:circadian clock protein KaiB